MKRKKEKKKKKKKKNAVGPHPTGISRCTFNKTLTL